jgi:carboxymethylenebutenolidase
LRRSGSKKLRASYRKEAAEDAWNEMIAWFKKYKVLA